MLQKTSTKLFVGVSAATVLFLAGYLTGREMDDAPAELVENPEMSSSVTGSGISSLESESRRGLSVSGNFAGAFNVEPTAKAPANDIEDVSNRGIRLSADVPAAGNSVRVAPPVSSRSATRAVQHGGEDQVLLPEPAYVRYPHAADLAVQAQEQAPYRYNQLNPSIEELSDRALIVSEEADRRTSLLGEQLQLNAAQQAAVFPIFARSSEAYSPLLPIAPAQVGIPLVGSEGGVQAVADLGPQQEDQAVVVEPILTENEVLEAVYPILDDEQQALLEQDYLDRDAWWSDVVGVLEADADAVIAAAAVGGNSTTSDDGSSDGSDLSAFLPGIVPENEEPQENEDSGL